ncbi:uncharacterized protein LOC111338957 [Stylophora pistillata]|nr:uncharacterized protein LOC111338957 [Stylophora pistillata]
MKRLQHIPLVMSSTPVFQKNLEYGVHGKNCEDIFCVLPQCVNFKLQTRNVSSSRKDKPNNHATGASGDRTASVLQNNNGSNTVSLNQAILDNNAEKKLLDDIAEIERFLEGQMGDTGPQPCFYGRFDIDEQNLLPPYTSKEDFQVSQQTDSLHRYNPKRDSQTPSETARNHQPYSRDYGAEFERKGYNLVKPSNSVAGRNTESAENPLFPSYYETFTSTDQFTVPLKKSEGIHAAKRSRKDPSVTKPMLVPTTIVQGRTACHLSGARQFPCIQSKPSRMAFGVLTQIMHMFEKPMSADVEAFFVHVLQKALIEMRNAASRKGSQV